MPLLPRASLALVGTELFRVSGIDLEVARSHAQPLAG